MTKLAKDEDKIEKGTPLTDGKLRIIDEGSSFIFKRLQMQDNGASRRIIGDGIIAHMQHETSLVGAFQFDTNELAPKAPRHISLRTYTSERREHRLALVAPQPNNFNGISHRATM